MIQIFQDIVAGDAQAVQDRLAKDPALIAAVAKGSPKKFVGQSPLQVAIQTGQTQIARLLIAAGADPNHADLDSPSGAGRPLIHDAVTFAIKSARWTRPVSFAPPITEWEIVGSEEAATEWFELVAALLDAGADASALGQAGTSVLGRAARAASDVLPPEDAPHSRPLNPELEADLTRLFGVLIEHGADPDAIEPQLGQSLADYYSDEPVGQFLRR